MGSHERPSKEAAVQTSSRHAGKVKHSTDRILLSTQDNVYRVAVLHELKELCSGTTIDQRSTNRKLERTVCTDIYHRTHRFHRRQHPLTSAVQGCIRPALAFNIYGKRSSNNNTTKVHGLYRQPLQQERALGSSASASAKHAESTGTERTTEAPHLRRVYSHTRGRTGQDI